MLETIADFFNSKEDLGKEIQNILHDKFMRKSLAIVFAAEAAYRDLVYTIAAVQKRVDAHCNA